MVEAEPQVEAAEAAEEPVAEKEAEAEAEAKEEAPAPAKATPVKANTTTPGRRSTREVKKVEVFTIEKKEVEDAELKVPEGSGEKLGKIENVEQRLGMTKAMDPLLKKIHTLLYPGQKSIKKNIKAHIRLFNGFSEADKEQSKLAAQEKLNTFEVAKVLKPMALFFDVERSGTKEQLVSNILDFLCEPASSGNVFAKKKGAAKKRKAKSSKKKKKVVREKKAMSGYMYFCQMKRDKAKKKNPDAGFAEMARILSGLWKKVDDDEKAEWKQKALDAFEAEGGSKKSKPAKKKRKKEASEEEESEEEEEEESDSDDDAPLAQGLNAELKTRIKAIIAAADLTELSQKKIREQLVEEFGEASIMSKKKDIKEFVNEVLQG